MLRALLLTIALAAGLTAAYLVQAVQPTEANANSDTTKAAAMQTVDILVAASDLPAGTTLRAEDMRWQAWPAEAANDAFIRYSSRPAARDDLAGMTLRAPLRAGTPVMDDQVGDTGNGFLSGVLTPGMRAVAIPVSAERTAGGFILPNNRVDVLLVTDCKDSSTCINGIEVRTILQNVRVLAIDQSGTDPDQNAVVGKTATLELSPEDSETLVAAEAAGKLSLVLRASEDETIVSLGNEEPAPKDEIAPASAQPQAVDRGHTVRVLRAGVAETYEVN